MVIAYDRSLVSKRLQSTLDYSRPKRCDIFCPICCLQACRCGKTQCTPLCSKWCERTIHISIQLNDEIAWNSQVINRDLCSHHLSTDLLFSSLLDWIILNYARLCHMPIFCGAACKLSKHASLSFPDLVLLLCNSQKYLQNLSLRRMRRAKTLQNIQSFNLV